MNFTPIISYDKCNNSSVVVLCINLVTSGKVTEGLSDCNDGSVHNITAMEVCVTIPLKGTFYLKVIITLRDNIC